MGRTNGPKLGNGGNQIDMKNEPIRGALIRFIPLLLPLSAVLAFWIHAPVWIVVTFYILGGVVWLVAGASSFNFGKRRRRPRL